MIARMLLCAGCLVLAADPVRADQPQPEKKSQAAREKVEAAQAAVDAWAERVAWAERMVKLGYISPAQAQADKARLAEAVIGLQKATEELKSLTPAGSLFDTLGRIARRYQIAKSLVDLARADLEQSRERVAWSERMVKKGYMSAAQVQAERARAESAAASLEKAVERLKAITPGK
jgi:outer membrane protein TolC